MITISSRTQAEEVEEQIKRIREDAQCGRSCAQEVSEIMEAFRVDQSVADNFLSDSQFPSKFVQEIQDDLIQFWKNNMFEELQRISNSLRRAIDPLEDTL